MLYNCTIENENTTYVFSYFLISFAIRIVNSQNLNFETHNLNQTYIKKKKANFVFICKMRQT